MERLNMQNSNTFTLDHSIKSKGYRIVKNGEFSYTLYYIDNQYAIEYGMYDTLDIALECASALLDTVRNPS